MDVWGIIWLFVLLIINAFFVGAEFAVISARRSQIEPLAASGSRSAKTALWAMEHATLMLAACQLGITVCSLLILNVSEPAIHHLLEVPLALTGLSEELISTVAFILALIIVSFLHVVLGEMVPKNLSFSIPDRAVLILAPPLVFIATVFRPIIVALNAIANGILRLFKVVPKNEANSVFTLDEVATIVAQSKREGVLMDAGGTLTGAFEFTSKKVRDVAIPMSGLVTLPEAAAPADLEKAVAQRGFSRYILLNDAGEPTGYLHLKDVIDLDESEFSEPVPPKRIRQLISMYCETDLEDALATMRRSGVHVARSFDATGETTGVLFLEDIIEVLVGEVQDATRRR
ncbi:HlyC/CorC family transporter [Salinibacterium sp. NSLL150]|uniref:hemolysin family protein n=1 Tax=unclassified Salinibacterium TaxID=2632331 RepID=UPI0018CD80E3|nr:MULTISPECIES: hemolysin family protein [unclassified Salinibacterium]MBH0025153.1 HlyC/CorC family transporter [Salinibacterium sp. SWN248]MBH0100246.1 HlyC/CorC family transporter [Salinibacterium sp. NSLL35]MBH0103000.1 HlyC/CorC family transporter [Salinibacterium sp. NSLL150]MBH0105760.1 HlyC/CorC family transporter [Salinibacterium sp. NSLL16]MBH0108520.1 HlyC/CorC family transporter [Salinibacterium sp. NSLL17]